METQPQPQTQATKPDRTLAVTCRPTLVWHSATPPYSIGATPVYSYNPAGSVPPMDGRVHQDGDLILHPLPSPQDYSTRVDITVTLDTSGLVDPEGNPVQGRWATENEYSGTGPVTGFGWFCRVQNVARRDYDTTPVQINGMNISRLSDTQIFIDDSSPAASPALAFCLGFVLPDYGNYYITFDPIITSKTGVQNPPV